MCLQQGKWVMFDCQNQNVGLTLSLMSHCVHFHNARVLSADLWSWWCNIFPHDTHIKTIMVDDITNHNNTFIYILSLSNLIKLDGWGNKINHFMVFEKNKKRKSFEMWSSNTFCVFWSKWQYIIRPNNFCGPTFRI
jgi:hypothetical protein